MNRSLIILLGALTLGTVVFAGSYFGGHYAGMKCCSNRADDLSWLRAEFHLSDTELARIRRLHDGYMPQCGEMCVKIAEKKHELEVALDAGPNVTAEAQAKLNELAALRAQCQGQMLEHFMEVSQAMPSDEGRRYLGEMKKLTLGLHEEIEQSMSDTAGHEHSQP